MRVFSFVALALMALCVDAGKGVFQATDGNFKGQVLGSGKNAFVKFLAPWWGHCKSMKADWDKLGAKYANSDAVMIVDADCTGPAKSICGSQGVKGYPTIKYYLAGKSGKAYSSGRDYTSLANFVKTTLDKEMCDALTGKGCKPIQVKFIEANKGKSANELKDMLSERKQKFKDLEKEFKEQKKAYKVATKKHKMAADILKKLAKNAASGHDEL